MTSRYPMSCPSSYRSLVFQPFFLNQEKRSVSTDFPAEPCTSHDQDDNRHRHDMQDGSDNHRVSNQYFWEFQQVSLSSFNFHRLYHDSSIKMCTRTPAKDATRETGDSNPADLSIQIF